MGVAVHPNKTVKVFGKLPNLFEVSHYSRKTNTVSPSVIQCWPFLIKWIIYPVDDNAVT